MKILRILPFCLYILFPSCASYLVEGRTNVPSLDGQKLYLKVSTNDNLIDLDSCEVLHGMFSMNGDVDSIALGSLFLAGESLMPIVVEKGKIKIFIENSRLEVRGTPLNERLYGFIKQKNLLEQRLMDVQHKQIQLIVNGTPTDNVDEMVNQENDALLAEMNELIIQFVTENFDNLLAVQIFKVYCLALSQPTITPTIQKIIEKAPDSFKQDAFVKEYLRLAKEGENQ